MPKAFTPDRFRELELCFTKMTEKKSKNSLSSREDDLLIDSL